RSSHQVQMEFPDLRKRYGGRHFWARGYFSTTSGKCHTSVSSEARTYRRQPVVMQLIAHQIPERAATTRPILRSSEPVQTRSAKNRMIKKSVSRLSVANAKTTPKRAISVLLHKILYFSVKYSHRRL